MDCKNKIFNKLKKFCEYIFNCDNSNITPNISDKNIYEIEINNENISTDIQDNDVYKIKIDNKKYYLIGKESIKI
tara:strand:+ start:214 stop:438 length:225 start_codon:yes stop_codon:yes gene_type:complete